MDAVLFAALAWPTHRSTPEPSGSGVLLCNPEGSGHLLGEPAAPLSLEPAEIFTE